MKMRAEGPISFEDLPDLPTYVDADEDAIRQYLSALFETAAEGFLAVFTLPNKTTSWMEVTNLTDAAWNIRHLADQDRNVYLGMGLQPRALGSDQRGKGADVCAIPGVWLDVDIAGPAHAQVDLPRSWEIVEEILAEFPLEPSLVVDSGHGAHAYWLFREVWTFEDDVDREHAARLIDRVQAAIRDIALSRGCTIDDTSDLARLLRPAGTVNRKDKPGCDPILVRIVRDTGRRYTIEEIEVVLPTDAGDEPIQARPTNGVDAGDRPPLGPILDECPFLQHCRDDAQTLSEPEWHAAISIVSLCENGEAEAHAISRDYPNYDAGETQRKFDLARAANKPMRCETIRQKRNGEPYCRLCKHRGTVKSPIALGRPRTTKPPKYVASSATTAGQPSAPTVTQPHFTDLGNAQRLVERHGQDMHYVPEHGSFVVWNGAVWIVDALGEVQRRAKETVINLYVEAPNVTDDLERKELVAHARRSEAHARLRDMIQLAKSEPGVAIGLDEFDRDPMLLTVANGTIDLRTGHLRPHAREDLITRMAAVDYDPAARCPAWQAFLDRVLDGNLEVITFIQRAIGYSLTGRTDERCLFILYGEGRNGKTTFLETVSALLGDHAVRTPTDTLLARRDGMIPNDVARLRGARFVFASEAEQGRYLAEAKIKDITGGDTVSARFMRAEWFDFRPQFKLWLGTNHKPRIRGAEDAIWDRLKLIHFGVRIPDEEVDKSLRDQLLAELPGILAWAVEGCLAWQRDGLGHPPAVRDAVDAYRKEEDILGGFIDERCIVDSSKRASASDLYKAYQVWCEAAGERPVEKVPFGRSLGARGFSSDQVGKNRVRTWKGIGLLHTSEHRHRDTRAIRSSRP